jgi:hypothetical protein
VCACVCACACACACVRVCMCACACACTSRQDLDDVPPADAGRASAAALPSLLADHDLAATDANVIVAVSVSTRSTLECPDSTHRVPRGVPTEYAESTRGTGKGCAVHLHGQSHLGHSHLGPSHLGRSHLGHSHFGTWLSSTEPTSAPGLTGWICRGDAAAAAERGRQGPKWESPKWEGTKRERPKWDWPCRCGCGR